MNIVYLDPVSGFTPNLRSDTIFGLLCWGIRTLYSEGTLTEFLTECKSTKPPLLVSSAFYFLHSGNGLIRYYPKPLLPAKDWVSYSNTLNTKPEKMEFQRKLKSYKKLQFLPEDLFFMLLTGKVSELELITNKSDLIKDVAANPFTLRDDLHNSIDRLTATTPEEGGLYEIEAAYANNSGMFFLLDCSAAWEEKILSVFNFYRHFGFGGNASTGYNHFKFTTPEFSLPEIPNANCFISLSLYTPTAAELQNYTTNPGNVWYELTERRGKVGGQFIKAKRFHKKAVFSFTEGSCFPLNNNTVFGSMTSVALQNEAELGFTPYHFGFAFPIPFYKENDL